MLILRTELVHVFCLKSLKGEASDGSLRLECVHYFRLHPYYHFWDPPLDLTPPSVLRSLSMPHSAYHFNFKETIHRKKENPCFHSIQPSKSPRVSLSSKYQASNSSLRGPSDRRVCMCTISSIWSGLVCDIRLGPPPQEIITAPHFYVTALSVWF